MEASLDMYGAWSGDIALGDLDLDFDFDFLGDLRFELGLLSTSLYTCILLAK